MSDGPSNPIEPKPEQTPAPAAATPHPDPAAPKPKETAADKPVVSTSHEKESGVGRVFSTIFHVLIWPLKIIFRPLVFRVSHERGNPKVFFTSFSPLIYLWPIMAMGWFGILTQDIIQPHILGWAWITVVLIVLITVAADLDRNRALVVAGLVLICWMLGFILESQQNWPVLSDIRNFFARQNVQFDPGTANVFSVVIFIILVGVVVVAWFDGRYEITTREITHKRAFRTSDSLPRAAKRIKRDWRDIAEVFLGLGAGDVIVLDSQKNIVMRIPNVPFLWFFRHDVDHILEVLATTEVEDIAAVMEEDDFS